jgi:hypothetical protein
MRMTLVVARIDGPRIAIASDTLLTEQGKALPIQSGTIKSCLLGNACVSFSNSPELAETDFKRFVAQHKDGAGFADTIAFFEQSSKNSGNDYIVPFDSPPRLVKIADGKRQGGVAKTVWIGDHSAYKAFRAYEGKIRSKAEHGRALNAVLFADEQTGSPASDLYSVMRNLVSDKGVPTVGGFVSVVSNRGNGFRFSVYSDMLFDWVHSHSADYQFALSDRVDLQVSGENSGYSIAQLSPGYGNANFVAFYFVAPKCMFVFYGINNGLANKCTVLQVGPADIQAKLNALLGSDLGWLALVTTAENKGQTDHSGIKTPGVGLSFFTHANTMPK